MYALFLASLNLAARARGPSDKSNPEMTSKSSEITQPEEGGGGTRGYEPADLRFGMRCGFTNTQINSGFIVPTGGGDWPIVLAARDAHMHTCMTLSSIKYFRCIS